MEHVKRVRRKQKKKSKALTVLLIFIIAIAAGVGGYAASQVFKDVQEIKESEEKYEYVLGQAVKAEEKEYNVDFETLGKINSNITGWIIMENTPINYPVVWSEDNEFYLKHLFTGEYNNAGCIYIETANSKDMTDKNTVMYGHNMKNGTMFAALLNYRKQEFYDANKVLYYIRSDGAMFRLEPFAGYISSGDDPYIEIEFDSTEAFYEYVNHKIANSTFRSSVQIQPEDRIVTLSTCSYHVNDGRYAVFCKSTEMSPQEIETWKKMH